MKYTILASGSKGNACLIESGETKVLIDCGTTKKYLLSSLNTIGVDLNNIDALLITHDHSDHTKQINTFKNHLVYSPVPLMINSQIVNPYEPFRIGNLGIFPIPTSHDSEQTVGYVIQNMNSKLVYVTDTGYIRNKDLKHIENADYYIFESNHDPQMLMKTRRPYAIKRRIMSEKGHLSNQEAGQILSKVVGDYTKEIVLAHLSEEANSPRLAHRTVRSYLEDHPVEIFCARQFEILVGGNVDAT